MQKTRSQNIEFWPNGGRFRDDNKFFQKFDFSVVFEKLFEFTRIQIPWSNKVDGRKKLSKTAIQQ